MVNNITTPLTNLKFPNAKMTTTKANENLDSGIKMWQVNSVNQYLKSLSFTSFHIIFWGWQTSPYTYTVIWTSVPWIICIKIVLNPYPKLLLRFIYDNFSFSFRSIHFWYPVFDKSWLPVFHQNKCYCPTNSIRKDNSTDRCSGPIYLTNYDMSMLL